MTNPTGNALNAAAGDVSAESREAQHLRRCVETADRYAREARDPRVPNVPAIMEYQVGHIRDAAVAHLLASTGSRQVPAALATYDAGLLPEPGGASDDWWQDAMRNELARAHEFYADQFAAFRSQPASRDSGEAMREWQPIETGPTDRWVGVFAPGAEFDLPDIRCVCHYSEDAGFCVDELRYPTHWCEITFPVALPTSHSGSAS